MLSQFDPMTFTIMVSGWVTAILILLFLLFQIAKTKQALQSSVHEKELRLEQSKLYADTRDYLTSVLPGKTLELMESKAKVSQDRQIQLVQHQLAPILRELSQLGTELQNRQKEEAFFKGGLERELQNLVSLNKSLSEEAHNLSVALEGQNKSQGIWGEMILERLLESTGMQKGRDFTLQQSFRQSDGSLFRPDAVIKLPRQRFLVIDSKVSLKPYIELLGTTDEQERLNSQKRLVTSIKNHIKGLESKNYDQLHGTDSLEAVLLFMPVEGALTAGLEADPNLLEYAFDHRIVITSPSSLLLTIKIVNALWQQDSRDSRTQRLLSLSDEFARNIEKALEELNTLGTRISAAYESYEKIQNRFTSKRNGLLTVIEKIKHHGDD